VSGLAHRSLVEAFHGLDEFLQGTEERRAAVSACLVTRLVEEPDLETERDEIVHLRRRAERDIEETKVIALASTSASLGDVGRHGYGRASKLRADVAFCSRKGSRGTVDRRRKRVCKVKRFEPGTVARHDGGIYMGRAG
jgi:hypothetical protein